LRGNHEVIPRWKPKPSGTKTAEEAEDFRVYVSGTVLLGTM
jgi:hypothetical protein